MPLPMPAMPGAAPLPPQALMYHQQPSAPNYDQPPFAQHHIHPDLRNAQTVQQPPQPPRPAQSPASAARQYAQAAQAAQLQQQQQQQQHQHHQQHQVQQQQQQHQQLQQQQHQHQQQQHQQYQPHRDLLPAPVADTPVHLRLPRNQEATCQLDSVMLDFMTERRRAAAQGTPSSSLVGPSYPSISSLLNPARAPKSHPLSKLFTDVLANLPDVSEIPELVACLYIMFLVMRWRIAPTQENYDRLPEWIRPIRAQLEVGHPIWFDNVPW
jgi:flagellar motor protein MotB